MTDTEVTLGAVDMLKFALFAHLVDHSCKRVNDFFYRQLVLPDETQFCNVSRNTEPIQQIQET